MFVGNIHKNMYRKKFKNIKFTYSTVFKPWKAQFLVLNRDKEVLP